MYLELLQEPLQSNLKNCKIQGRFTSKDDLKFAYWEKFDDWRGLALSV